MQTTKGKREKLPNEREGFTHRFVLGGEHKGYVTVGLYPDGRVGEIFAKMNDQGTTVSGFIDAWAISVSMLLQLGMPLAEICAKFKSMRFEPSGFSDNPDINFAHSPIDYIAQWLEGRFVDTDLWGQRRAEAEVAAPSGSKIRICSRDGCAETEGLRLHFGLYVCGPCTQGLTPRKKAP
jgi:ribonucleoside-diphosphate reductase alpha chain